MRLSGTNVRRSRRPAASLSLNLTAMIDVVFLLLIYFMAATEFKLGEEVYRLDMPQRGVDDPFALPRDPLRISVISTSAGDEPGNYLLRLTGAAAQPSTFEELHEYLRQSQRGTGAFAGIFESDHPILIEPGTTTRWEHAIEAYSAAARARYTNVTFAPAGL